MHGEPSPPLLRATKYVHALRCPVSGHPRRPSPGQTWSLANFRSDLSAQLLLSHWRRGRVWGGWGGAVREGDVCEGMSGSVPDISPSPLPSGLGGFSALPAGEISRAGAVPGTRGLARRRYRGSGVHHGHLVGEKMGMIFQNVLLGARVRGCLALWLVYFGILWPVGLRQRESPASKTRVFRGRILEQNARGEWTLLRTPPCLSGPNRLLGVPLPLWNLTQHTSGFLSSLHY